MRYLLIAAGLIFAALFGLSAMASDASEDFKYPTVALQTSGMPALDARCTPLAAQAESLPTMDPKFDAGNDASLIAKTPSATPGGASLGVATALTYSFYI